MVEAQEVVMKVKEIFDNAGKRYRDQAENLRREMEKADVPIHGKESFIWVDHCFSGIGPLRLVFTQEEATRRGLNTWEEKCVSTQIYEVYIWDDTLKDWYIIPYGCFTEDFYDEAKEEIESYKC